MDKQQTQYLLIPKLKWKMLTNCLEKNSKSEWSVQTFVFVYHDTNGPNHGPVLKTQLFLLSGICTVIFWQDLWERTFEKILLQHGWEKVTNWECLFVHRGEGLFSSVFVDDIYWLGRNTTLIRCGKYSTKKSIWENQHLFWIMYTWDALKDNVK